MDPPSSDYRRSFATATRLVVFSLASPDPPADNYSPVTTTNTIAISTSQPPSPPSATYSARKHSEPVRGDTSRPRSRDPTGISAHHLSQGKHIHHHNQHHYQYHDSIEEVHHHYSSPGKHNNENSENYNHHHRRHHSRRHRNMMKNGMKKAQQQLTSARKTKSDSHNNSSKSTGNKKKISRTSFAKANGGSTKKQQRHKSSSTNAGATSAVAALHHSLPSKEVAPPASVDLRRVYSFPSRSGNGTATDDAAAMTGTGVLDDDDSAAVASALRQSKSDLGGTSAPISAAILHGGSGGTASAATTPNTLASSQAMSQRGPPPPPPYVHKVDRYGFILNMDSNGNIEQALASDAYDDAEDAIPSFAQVQRTQRRLKKWGKMMSSSASTLSATTAGTTINNPLGQHPKRRSKLVTKRLRKGIPDSIRGRVWTLLGNVPNQIQRHPGMYDQLVRETILVANPTTATTLSSNLTNQHPNVELSSSPDTSASSYPWNSSTVHTRSFLNLQDTIERDIHRTFPRHALFYDATPELLDDVDHDITTNNGAASAHSAAAAAAANNLSNDDEDDSRNRGLCGTTEISDMIRELEFSNGSSSLSKQQPATNATTVPPSVPSSPPPPSPATIALMRKNTIILDGKGGQASLRRVLKAYSLYDREVGYCQGMNFITGMFLTLMTEEEAFWLLVCTFQRKSVGVADTDAHARLESLCFVREQCFFNQDELTFCCLSHILDVMQEHPCKMRGLFGEGMKETHQVLYVAEKLISQFLPRLAKHLEREHIHITMFATQWLLTQYTSSFRFDLVTRVWDCFLGEGWKITYRVMLAILGHWQGALLKMSFEEILAFFRELPDRIEGAAIMDAAIKIPLRRQHILKYEKEYQEQQRQQK